MNTNTQAELPAVVRSAPERIWLNVSDEAEHNHSDFPRNPDGDEVCWSKEPALQCAVEYVRADLAAQAAKLPALSDEQIAGEFASWCRSKGMTAAGCDNANVWIRYAFEAGVALATPPREAAGAVRPPDYPGEVDDPEDRARLAKLFAGKTVAGVLAEIGVTPSAPSEAGGER